MSGYSPEYLFRHEFFLEEFDGKPKLERYYSQVQGLMGLTVAWWCYFHVYTSKGMSSECTPFDAQFELT